MGQQTMACVPCSIHEEAKREAERHKWIVSEKMGQDVGVGALREWCQKYWIPFCRFRRIEHVRGDRFWIEYGEHTFGKLYPLIRDHDPLVEAILDRVAQGLENLEIICWALDEGHSMDQVRYILEQLDINSARLEPGFLDL